MNSSAPRAVPFFDYRPWLERVRPAIDAALARVLGSGRLILGPEGEAFEREFAGFVGSRTAVGVASGTDAIILALRALSIGDGDEVITVANAGVPTIAAIRAACATPRFVDVLPGSLLMDPAALPSALTPRTRCIIPIHLYGQPAPLEPILDFARAHDLRVVEDCAQAHGATYRGRHVGRFGDVGCFSFYPTKNLGALGDGGLCVTDDPGLDERLRMLRFYGFSTDRQARVEGLNSRLDELQAAVLRVQLPHLPGALEARRQIAQAYRAGLRGTPLAPPPVPADVEHAYHLFVVQSPQRQQLIAALDAEEVGHGVHYPAPVHTMEAYRFLGGRRGSLPSTERACDEVLSLPLYPGLAAEDVRRVVQVLRAAVEGQSD